MAIERVRKYFIEFGLEEKIIEFDTSSATVELAAAALNCEPGRIAKTLAFKVDDRCILIVVSGDSKVDNKKYKNSFKVRPKFLSPDEVLELVGHAVGGVCPFAINERPDKPVVYLDISLKRFDTVYPACGSDNSVIELTIDELKKHSGYIGWVDVSTRLNT